MKRSIMMLTLGIVCAMCAMVIAAVPSQITLQGILWDAGGNPVADASYSVVFKIYDAPTGGNVLWSETQLVSTTGGVYTVLLGSSTPLPDSTFNGSSRWLGMKVGADPEMSPRQQLVSTGYSFVSSQWTSAGQNLFRLNGNVGIGTTTPAQKLDVAGSAQMTGFKMPTGATNGFVLTSDASGIGTWQAAGAGGPFVNLQAGTPGSQQTGHLNISGTGLFGGNVGIGTTSPAQKLDVNGTAQMNGFKMPTGSTNGFVLTSDPSGVGSWQAPPASGIGGSGTVNYVPKFTGATAIGNSAIYETGGNVGIGTTSPAAKLHVKGDIIVPTLSKIGLTENLNSEIITYGDQPPFNIPSLLFTAHPTRGFLFGNYDGTTWTPRVHFTASGNVGIGTTSPGFMLEVTGSAGKPGGGSWSASSDIRLKKNVKPIEGALERMLKLRGVTYQWKEPEKEGNMTGTYMGMIAQEVEKTFPEWVGSKANGYKTLTFIGFEALSVEAIRELYQTVQEQKAEIDGLKVQAGEIEGLKTQLSELQNLVRILSVKLRSTGDNKMANSEEGTIK